MDKSQTVFMMQYVKDYLIKEIRSGKQRKDIRLFEVDVSDRDNLGFIKDLCKKKWIEPKSRDYSTIGITEEYYNYLLENFINRKNSNIKKYMI